MVRGCLALLVALGESLKSWMASDGILSVGTGSEWLGRFKCEQGRALFIDYEAGDYEVRRRLQRLAVGRGFATPVQGIALLSMPPWPITSDEFFAHFETLATEYALIVIDSLAGGSGGGDENDSRFAGALYRLKSVAAATGCVVLVIHHARKSSPNSNDHDPREMVRGSSAIFNSVDVVLYLRRHGEGQSFLVTQAKARGTKRIEPFVVSIEDVGADASVMRSGDPSDEPEVEDDAGTFNAVKAKVVRLLACEHDLRSASEIYRRIRGTKKTVLEAVKELEERQTITRHQGAYRLTSEVHS
jgi:hypothetical protein